jgi:plastocyanin
MKRHFFLVFFLLGCFFAPAAPSSYSQDTAQAIEIHARRFSFSPSEITVKKGDTVKLNLGHLTKRKFMYACRESM